MAFDIALILGSRGQCHHFSDLTGLLTSNFKCDRLLHGRHCQENGVRSLVLFKPKRAPECAQAIMSESNPDWLSP
eukprot:5264553-Amphidinium_carterae.2